MSKHPEAKHPPQNNKGDCSVKNEIQVTAENGTLTVSSRDVAERFGKAHKRVMQTIRELDCSDDFGRHNFVPVEYIDGKGEKRPSYCITRDGFTFLAMGFTGKEAAQWKEKYIAAFSAMEARLKQPVDLNDPDLLRGLLSNYAERTEIAEAKLVEMQPAVDAFDRISKADGSICFRDAAKNLQLRPKDMVNFLSQNGWVYRQAQKGPWLGYQSKITSGLLEHKVHTVDRSDGTEKITTQCRITPKGLAKLSKLIPSKMLEVA